MNHPLHLKLNLEIQESTCPTKEFPDSSPKLSVVAVCSGKQFSTRWQPISTMANREELVGILMQVVATKVVEHLDILNEEGQRFEKLSRSEWTPIYAF